MEKEIELEQEAIVVYSGGGAVNSVNGYTGDVVLTTSDLENTSDYQTGTEVESAISTAIAGKQNTLTAGSNITISGDTISATDTTYSNFVGTDGTAAGTAGLVPAPATTDAGKFLKADGTWDTAGGGGGPTVVQTTGTSTTDVMSQNAVTSMVFANPGTNTQIRIGSTGNVSNYAVRIGHGGQASSSSTVSIGSGTQATSQNSVALGADALASHRGSVALGSSAQTTVKGQIMVGTTNTYDGYNSSNYRLISGVYDGQNAHDAATYGQVISYSAINGAGAPTTATEGKYVGQLYYDTTNEAMYFLKTIDTTTTPATYTWEALGGGSSVNVVQTTGTSTTDVMSQKAVTDTIFEGNDTGRIKIGTNSSAKNASVSIGEGAGQYSAGNTAYSVALGAYSGRNLLSGISFSVALGSYATPTRKGEVNVGTGTTTNGYNSTNYRVLGGVHDPQSAHDAATKGYVDPTTDSSAPTTATVGRLGQIQIDTATATAYMCVAVDTVTPAYTWKQITA